MAVFRDFCRMLKSALVALVVVFGTFCDANSAVDNSASPTCWWIPGSAAMYKSHHYDQGDTSSAHNMQGNYSNSNYANIAPGAWEAVFKYGTIRGQSNCLSDENTNRIECHCTDIEYKNSEANSDTWIDLPQNRDGTPNCGTKSVDFSVVEMFTSKMHYNNANECWEQCAKDCAESVAEDSGYGWHFRKSIIWGDCKDCFPYISTSDLEGIDAAMIEEESGGTACVPEANQIGYNKHCYDVLFEIDTTQTNTFSFDLLMNSGDFIVDWGAYGDDDYTDHVSRYVSVGYLHHRQNGGLDLVPSSNSRTTKESFSSGGVWGTRFTHTYSSNQSHKIRFARAVRADGNNDVNGEWYVDYLGDTGTIRFGNTGNNNPLQCKVAAVRGSLGALLPTLSWGSTNLTAQPRFTDTFNGCSSLTSVPSGLFGSYTVNGRTYYGVSGAPVSDMFKNTFKQTSLSHVPATLFGTISGAPAVGVFQSTFEDVSTLTSVNSYIFNGISGSPAADMFKDTFKNTGLTSVPYNLFSNISGSPVARMFSGTFYNCPITSVDGRLFNGISGTPATEMFYQTFANTGLTQIPSNMFSGISGSPASNMFKETFANCDSLLYVPNNLFANVRGVPASGMFDRTFYDNDALTSIPADLFNGLTGSPAADMMKDTFRGSDHLNTFRYSDNSTSQYIPATFFGGVVNPNENNTGFVSNIFAGTSVLAKATGVENNCPTGLHQYNAGKFESDYTPKISCSDKTTIHFNSDGGTGGQSADVVATYGQAMPEISTTAPVKNGYTFRGWVDENNIQYYNADGASVKNWDKEVEEYTLHAQWHITTYTIKYYCNNNTLVSPSATQIIHPADGDWNLLTRPNVCGNAPTGYYYSNNTGGWKDGNVVWLDGASNRNINGDEVITGDKTLIAKWEPITSVINLFTHNGDSHDQYNERSGCVGCGSTGVAPCNAYIQCYSMGNPVQYGQNLPSIGNGWPTWAGHRFAGFYDANGLKYYDENGYGVRVWDKTGQTADLHAHWVSRTIPEGKYWDDDLDELMNCPTGYTSDQDMATSKYDCFVELSTGYFVETAGDIQIKCNSNSTGRNDGYCPKGGTRIYYGSTGGRTVLPNWECNGNNEAPSSSSMCTRLVRLYYNDGTNHSTAKNCVYGQSCTFSVNNLTQTGYTFTGGWGTSSNCTDNTSSFVITSTAPTLSPYYACKTYNACNRITMDNTTNGGSTPNSYLYKKINNARWYSDSDCTTEVRAAAAPVKTGFVFDGYYLNAAGTDTQVGSGTSPSSYLTISNWTVTKPETVYATYGCDDNKLYYNGTCINAPFKITTTDMGRVSTDDAVFKFKLSAAGTFYVDWGDGNVQKIERNSVTAEQLYSHTYDNPGVYTIKFAGLATEYSGSSIAAIRFGVYSLEANPPTNHHVAAISGSLGAIFPTLQSATVKQPKFYGTFAMTDITSIPSGLFDGVSGATGYMFAYTFSNTYITSIPSGLFANFTDVAPYMFYHTFEYSTLESLSGFYFSTIADSDRNAAPYMFAYTFANTNLQSLPNNSLFSDFATYTVEEGCSSEPASSEGLFLGMFEGTPISYIPDSFSFGYAFTAAPGLFANTFSGCQDLQYIPANLFANVKCTPQSGMFFETFSGDTLLQGFKSGQTIIPYVPTTFFSGLNQSSNYSDTEQMFKNTQISESCPQNMYVYSTGFENVYSPKVSCAACPSQYPHSANNNTGGATACYATVTYNTNDGTLPASVNNPKNVYYTSNAASGYKINPLPTPTKTYRVFDGWYKNSDFSGGVVTTNTVFNSGDQNLYAKWTYDGYTIYLDKNDPDATAGSTEIYTEYNKGVYLDANHELEMDTVHDLLTKNVIKIPTGAPVMISFEPTNGDDGSKFVVNKKFQGYYGIEQYANTQYINDSGSLTDDGLRTGIALTWPTTWYAHWGCAPVAVPETPTRDGYVFVGWYDAPVQGNEIKTDSVCSLTDMTLYAQWQECDACKPGDGCLCELSVKDNTCTYTTYAETGYEVVSGNDTAAPQCNLGNYEITLNNPNNNGTTKIYTTYTDDVYLDSARTESLTSGVYQIETPTRDGYVFDGYYDALDGYVMYIDADGLLTEDGATEGLEITNNSNVWYAQWIETGCPSGTYYENGECKNCSGVGDGSYTSSDGALTDSGQCYKTCELACSVDQSLCPAHATLCTYDTTQKKTGKDYYGGLGCNAVSSICEMTVTECEEGYYISADNKSCEQSASYTISLNINGGSANGTPTTLSTVNDVGVYNNGNKMTTTGDNPIVPPTGSSVILTLDKNTGSGALDISNVTKNLAFAGFYSAQSNDDEYIDSIGVLTQPGLNRGKNLSANDTWYAHWDCVDVTLPILNRQKYEFDGWYDSGSDGTKKGDGGDEYCVGQSETLYAHWTSVVCNTAGEYYDSGTNTCTNCPDEYPNSDTNDNDGIGKCYASVTYNVNGGSAVVPNPQKIYYAPEISSGYTISSLPNTTKNNYALVGWYDNSGFNGNKVTTNTVFSDGDQTLYAKWEQTYTVEFEPNANGDNSGEKSPVTCIYDTDCDIANRSEITRDNYGFVGWSKSANSSTAEYTNIINDHPDSGENSITLYAIWDANFIPLEYRYNRRPNDIVIQNQSCSVGSTFSTYTLPEDVTKSGYDFVGWSYEKVTQ